MRVTVLTGIIFSVVFVIVKMIFFYTQPVGYDITPLVLLNLFLLISSISIGLYLQKRRDTEESNGLRDIKNGMTAGVPYGVIVSLFLFVYYSNIDPEYNAHQIIEKEYEIEKQLANPKQFKKIQDSNPDFEVLSKEEIKEKVMEGLRSTYSPNSVLTLSLLGMIVMSAVNSIFITIIYRRIVFRPRKQ